MVMGWLSSASISRMWFFGKGHEKKAAVAIAHTLLNIAWAALRYDSDYIDAGADYYERRDQRNREQLVRYHQNALARLGIQLTMTHPGDGTPPPPDNPGHAALLVPHLTGPPVRVYPVDLRRQVPVQGREPARGA